MDGSHSLLISDRRRALELLAATRDGYTEAMMLAHGVYHGADGRSVHCRARDGGPERYGRNVFRRPAPIEAQIYEVWVTTIAFPYISKAPLRKQELLRRAIQYFPGIRSADRAGRKRIGLKVLNQAMTDPDLRMQFKREVVLPRGNQRSKPTVERN